MARLSGNTGSPSGAATELISPFATRDGRIVIEPTSDAASPMVQPALSHNQRTFAQGQAAQATLGQWAGYWRRLLLGR
jgi:hypothetical protein